MTKIKLKPCPWCGETHDLTLMSLSGVRVTCDCCCAEGPAKKSASAAKKAWNDRIGTDINDQLLCLYEIRCIIGDKAGKLMHDELVERVREMADHFRKVTKKVKGEEI